MKKIIYSGLTLVFALMMLASCKNTYTDLMTADVKTGGILVPTKALPYSGAPEFTIPLTVPKGPGVVSVEVYRTYTGNPVEVLDQTISVASANKTADKVISISYTYAKLIAGLNMSSDQGSLKIGDAWTLRYVSVMEDSRKVDVGPKTTITVANKYAGYYQCVGVFTHPVNGPRPINERKFLTPINAVSCWGNAGDLGASGYFVKITVDPATNLVTCGTWTGGSAIAMANIPGGDNYYDPATGVFHLSYFYVGATGNRLMNEVWTPAP
ncbi:MAG: DUF4361 domain-containing protein [Mariniphaga sp.]